MKTLGLAIMIAGVALMYWTLNGKPASANTTATPNEPPLGEPGAVGSGVYGPATPVEGPQPGPGEGNVYGPPTPADYYTH